MSQYYNNKNKTFSLRIADFIKIFKYEILILMYKTFYQSDLKSLHLTGLQQEDSHKLFHFYIIIISISKRTWKHCNSFSLISLH